MPGRNDNKKSGILTDEENAKYADINSRKAEQLKEYAEYLTRGLGTEGLRVLEQRCSRLGFKLNVESGRVDYAKDFKPIKLNYDLCYVRHGRTEGNTEPRVFQGQVDYPENQLNEIGLKQAEEAAAKMQTDPQTPDLLVFSPLTRARATGEAFARRHPEIPAVTVDAATEMAFGAWDGLRVIDIPPVSMAHLFYLEQNVIVRCCKPHVVSDRTLGLLPPGTAIPGECFIDVLERMTNMLHGLEKRPEVTSVAVLRRPLVVIYGHSMAGAAVSMLLGHGKATAFEGFAGLGFDGRYIMPNATPTHLPPQVPPKTLFSSSEMN